LKKVKLFLLLFFSIAPLFGGSSSELEAKVKAAYIYNFVKFVEWPQKPQKIKICVVGDETVSSILSGLAQKGAAMEIVASPYDCHLLYLSTGEQKTKELLSKNTKTGVLTVGDGANLIRHGGVIELYEESGKIKFAVSLTAAQRANLKISSKLLELAKIER